MKASKFSNRLYILRAFSYIHYYFPSFRLRPNSSKWSPEEGFRRCHQWVARIPGNCQRPGNSGPEWVQKAAGRERDIAAETDWGWTGEGPAGNSCHRCRKYEEGMICFFLASEVDDAQIKLAKEVSNSAIISGKKHSWLFSFVFLESSFFFY